VQGILDCREYRSTGFAGTDNSMAWVVRRVVARLRQRAARTEKPRGG
jgi:hypothetical protein